MSFTHYRQADNMDCGPTCVRMIAKYCGASYSAEYLRQRSYLSKEGVSLLGISKCAEAIGFRTLAVKIGIAQLVAEAPLPCIAHWKQEHFVVVYKATARHIYVADPAHGTITYTHAEFIKHWLSEDGQGIALLFETTPQFFALQQEQLGNTTVKGFGFLFQYLRGYRRLIIQLFLGLLIGSVLQLLLPFLTQSIVDVGVNTRNLNFIYVLLAAQLFLFISRTTVDFVRGHILLHIGSRIDINLVSDFLLKLMRLPIAYFDSKKMGDIMQRIADNQRIQQFLSVSSINVLFSMVNLVLFSGILAFYNSTIFFIFLGSSVLYVVWIVAFLKRRRDLDFKRYSASSSNQESLFQLIQGMQEIKLHNCETQKRWEWERIQATLYTISYKGLQLDQLQQAGAFAINEGKNILITFLAAKAVIDGQMTLGMMLSVQYIIGQLNAPIEQLIGFMHTAQDAKISLERLSEIHNQPDEEQDTQEQLNELPANKTITLSNVSFQYDAISNGVLNDVSLTIPQGKITAIVGTSGSGKTTLLKLLLGFYAPTKGTITVGATLHHSISHHVWRASTGVVMQDGFIFNDTIAKNIAVGYEVIQQEQLIKASHTANIQPFIDELPLGYATKIGNDGHGLSVGQKQRLLIARAVYKNPDYILFDEATNALDANNESIIMKNLNEFFIGRTVVVVAHRLSTVKNAHNIVVLHNGEVVEQGTHAQLIALKGSYYELVKNQLELN